MKMVFIWPRQDLKKYLDGLARKGQQLSPQLIKVSLIDEISVVGEGGSMTAVTNKRWRTVFAV